MIGINRIEFVFFFYLFQLKLDPLQQIDYAKLDENAVNAIDLLTIEKSIENTAYRCFESFWADIKWIVHNIKSRNKRK